MTKKPRITATIPSVRAVEDAIGIKAADWAHRCHEIACAMLEKKLVEGVERYGHFYGRVAPAFPRCGLPFQRHGWIETPAGLIVDPTRWVFEMDHPYIYVGVGDGREYDAGGQRLAASRVGVYPAGPHAASADDPGLTESQRDTRRKITQLGVEGTALARLAELTGGQSADFNFDQIFWLANLPVSWWGDDAAAVYAALAAAGYRAAIPHDYWRMAMDEPMAANLPRK